MSAICTRKLNSLDRSDPSSLVDLYNVLYISHMTIALGERVWLTHLVQIGSALAVLSGQSEWTCLLLTLCPPLSYELESTAQRSNH